MTATAARILVVDDEFSVRDSLSNWFRKDGYQVRAVGNATEALRALQDERVDVALLDIKMPGIDGMDLQEHIHRIDPRIAVIMITAFASVETAVRDHRAVALALSRRGFDGPLRDALERAIETFAKSVGADPNDSRFDPLRPCGRPARARLPPRSASASIPESSSVVVAVSGGSDSVGLLHLLRRSAPAREWRLTVAHLDHGMRRGSKADRRFVEALSGSLGLPCLGDRREVPALRRRGESPEEAARRVRREFLLACAEKVGASRIALGHTLDDQAETVLLRLVRGAGPAALAGMIPEGPGPFVRPLLGLERNAVRDWLERLGISFREDPTNRKVEVDRNRLHNAPQFVDGLRARFLFVGRNHGCIEAGRNDCKRLGL